MQGCVKLILLSGLLQGCLTGGELLLAAAAQHQLFSARFSNGGDPKILVEAGKTGEVTHCGDCAVVYRRSAAELVLR
jgi:hypothetical protein